MGEYNWVIKCYQPSLKDKLTTVNSLKADVSKIVGKGAEKLLFSKFLVQYIRSTCMQVNLKNYDAW